MISCPCRSCRRASFHTEAGISTPNQFLATARKSPSHKLLDLWLQKELLVLRVSCFTVASFSQTVQSKKGRNWELLLITKPTNSNHRLKKWPVRVRRSNGATEDQLGQRVRASNASNIESVFRGRIGEIFGNGKNAGVRDSAPEATCDAGSSFVRRMAVRVRVLNPAPSPLTSHRLASSSSIARGELTNINPPLPAHSLPNRKRKRKRRTRQRRSLQFSQGRASVSRRTYEALPEEGRLRPPCRWRRGCLHGRSHGVS